MVYVDKRRLLLLLPVALLVLAGLFASGRLRAEKQTSPQSVEPAKVVAAGVGQEEPEATEGHLAPDFDAPSLAGPRIRLSDYRGKAVLINFWGTTCVSCLAEIPDLERLSKDLGPQGLVIIGVNVGDSSDRARSFFQGDLGGTYPSALDSKQVIARTYRAPGLPVSVFIDAQGRIQKIIFGQINYKIFDRFARMALGQTDVPGQNDPLPLRFISPLPATNPGQ